MPSQLKHAALLACLIPLGLSAQDSGAVQGPQPSPTPPVRILPPASDPHSDPSALLEARLEAAISSAADSRRRVLVCLSDKAAALTAPLRSCLSDPSSLGPLVTLEFELVFVDPSTTPSKLLERYLGRVPDGAELPCLIVLDGRGRALARREGEDLALPRRAKRLDTASLRRWLKRHRTPTHRRDTF